MGRQGWTTIKPLSMTFQIIVDKRYSIELMSSLFVGKNLAFYLPSPFIKPYPEGDNINYYGFSS